MTCNVLSETQRNRSVKSIERKVCANEGETVAGVGTFGRRRPVLSACYTTRGAGEDLSAAGKSIEHSADKNTSY